MGWVGSIIWTLAWVGLGSILVYCFKCNYQAERNSHATRHCECEASTTHLWPPGRIIPKNFHSCQKLPDVCGVSRQVQCSLKDFSSVRHTTDAHARPLPTTVKALEIVHWGYRASVVCLDNWTCTASCVVIYWLWHYRILWQCFANNYCDLVFN